MSNKVSERKLLEDYLIQELERRNIPHKKGNSLGVKGFPDREVYGYKTYYIELKLGKENKSYYKQTPMQKKWQEQLSQGVNEYYLLSTREEIDKVVEHIFNECREHNIKNYFSYNTII